jgi:hypothetical protein
MKSVTPLSAMFFSFRFSLLTASETTLYRFGRHLCLHIGYLKLQLYMSVFLAKAALPKVGASTTARIAVTPIARNIALLFIAK